MKGKKIDLEFISSFIEQCIMINKTTPEEIVQEAQLKIDDIENRIQEIEDLKKQRSKLLDVTFHFRKLLTEKEKDNNLIFDTLSDNKLCKELCIQASQSLLTIDSISQDNNKIFCIKQLLERGILIKISNTHLSMGHLFNRYMSYIQ